MTDWIPRTEQPRQQHPMIPLQGGDSVPIWQVNEGDYDQLGYQTNLDDLWNLIDYTTTAPVKTALMEVANRKHDGFLKQLKGSLEGFFGSFGSHPSEAPTGKQIATEFGSSPKTFKEATYGTAQDPDLYPDWSPAGMIGQGIDFGADWTNFTPFGAMLAGKGMIGKVAKKGDKIADTFRAYHGSPHSFDKFSMDKLGTGEGAQAFGHGLYFTDEKGIAEGYAKTLGEKGYSVGGEVVDGYFNQVAKEIKEVDKGNIDKFISRTEKYLKKPDPMIEDIRKTNPDRAEALYDIQRENLKKAKEWKTKGEKVTSNKNLYSVNLPKGDYLKWDEPVNNSSILEIIGQKRNKDVENYWEYRDNLPLRKREATKKEIKKIRNLADKAKKTAGEGWHGSKNIGSEIYRKIIKKYGSPEKASQALNKVGIKGIDYPAGSLSNVKDSKARNYVMFDDKDISIEEIKKLMLLGGAGLGAGALYNKNLANQ